MNAIPTTYAGVRFRSRLEARWASFFDVVGWPWLYEPHDLGGYIPDFALPVGWDGEERPLLVEVKPALYVTELAQHAPKIIASGWTDDALLVGGALFEQADSGRPVLGLMVNRDRVVTVCVALVCNECRRIAPASAPHLEMVDGEIRHTVGRRWMRCRLCGDTGAISGSIPVVDDAREAWATAGNTVQWGRAS
jgi:hypothetical protein